MYEIAENILDRKLLKIIFVYHDIILAGGSIIEIIFIGQEDIILCIYIAGKEKGGKDCDIKAP